MMGLPAGVKFSYHSTELRHTILELMMRELKKILNSVHIFRDHAGHPFEGIPEHRRIRFHRGIQGIGDLDPSVYEWDEPVAKLTITRVN